MDMCIHPERLMTIKRQAFHDVSSSRTTWQSLSVPSSIKQTQIKHNDSHPRGV